MGGNLRPNDADSTKTESVPWEILLNTASGTGQFQIGTSFPQLTLLSYMTDLVI